MEELKKKASLNALTHISDEPTIDNADSIQESAMVRSIYRRRAGNRRVKPCAPVMKKEL